MPRVLGRDQNAWKKWVHMLLGDARISTRDIKSLSLILPSAVNALIKDQGQNESDVFVLDTDIYDKILLTFVSAGEYEV